MRFPGKFDSFVCEGDAIACEIDGFEIVARIVRDDCPDAPDERQDGFWPSYDIGAPGFFGPGNKFRTRFAEAHKRAEEIMAAWKNDEWFYCGIVLSIAREGVTLDDHAACLFGIEANYPDSDNSYLTEVANELLAETLDAGRAALARLCARRPSNSQSEGGRP